ncbi:MAG: hypothetical protein Q9160_003009 [Pyrenula sp. 1 TL-2023]
MYKNRITKWGMYKRRRPKAARSEGDKPSSPGKDCYPSPRSSVQDASKWKRLALSQIPVAAMTPETLRLPELITKSIHNYNDGAFDASIWFAPEGIWDLTSQKPGGDHVGTVERFFDRNFMACILFDQGLHQEAGKALDEAYALIKDILEAEFPTTLPVLSALLIYLVSANRGELVPLVLKQFTRLARIILPEQHPLLQVLKSLIILLTVDPSQIEHVSLLTMQSCLNALREKLGPMHHFVLRFQCKMIEMYGKPHDPNGAQATLQALAQECERSCGENDARTLDVLDSLVEVHLENEEYDEAARIAKRILRHAPTVSSKTQSMSLKVSGSFQIARVHFEQQRPEMAVKSLEEVIDLSLSISSTNETLSQRFLLLIMSWFQALGMTDQADYLNAALRKYDSVEDGQKDLKSEFYRGKWSTLLTPVASDTNTMSPGRNLKSYSRNAHAVFRLHPTGRSKTLLW